MPSVVHALALYQRRLLEDQLRIELRHVGGHRGTVTPRNAVNTACDRACDARLEEARAAISLKQKERPREDHSHPHPQTA